MRARSSALGSYKNNLGADDAILVEIDPAVDSGNVIAMSSIAAVPVHF